MSLHLTSFLGNRYERSVSTLHLVGQHMCYHRGERIEEVAWSRLALPPDNLRQALTRMVRAPARESILVLPGEVTVQQMTSHFISLHSVVLR